MERQWSLVAVLLLSVQARANPWTFGEDHPNFRVIYQKDGHIMPFCYNTRQIITVPPCMSLKYVWVKVSNTLGFTPTVTFHKTLNVVSIVYGLLQYTGSEYSIVVRGYRTQNCNPGVHQPEHNYIPYRLKGQISNKPRSKIQKMKYSVNKNRLQRKGQDKEALDAVDWKNSGDDDDLNDKKYGYDNDSQDKYVSVKESNEDISNELKEVRSGEKPNYMVFIITGNKATQATAENGGNVGHDRVNVKGDDSDDHGLDYGNGKNYSPKASKYIGLGEYSKGKGHAKSTGYDRGTENAKGDSYKGYSDGNRQSKKEAYSVGSGLESDDGNSMINGYGGTNRHVKDKTSLGYGKGKGYGGSSNDENDQDDSDDTDSESYRDTKNKNSVGNIKGSGSGHRGSSNEDNYEGDSYDADIRYVGSSGHATNEGYGLDDDYLDVIGIKNQPDGRQNDIKRFCSYYLRANSEGLAVEKKVLDYCLFEVGRSNF